MKRNVLKRVLGMFLAVAMVGSLAACGQKEKEPSQESTPASSSQASSEQTSEASKVEEKKDPVTLEWYYYGLGAQKDTQKVEDYVNELLKDYPGLEHVTIHIHPTTGAEYAQQVLLAQTTNQQIDIVNTYEIRCIQLYAETVGLSGV